jgi:hypothetical protein
MSNEIPRPTPKPFIRKSAEIMAQAQNMMEEAEEK